MGKTSFRAMFDTIAEDYDAVRPSYPQAVFDTIVRVTEVAENASLLEIGPGTGQATKAFATRGYKITAVELGEQLAALCRKNLAAYPKVRVINGSFEHVRFLKSSVDLVYAATALHWVAAEKRFRKPHTILKSGGHLAIIHTQHVSDGEGDAFYFAMQPISVKYRVGAERHNNFTLPKRADMQPDALDQNLFTQVHFEIFPIVITYSAKDYVRLLGTYSPILAMEPSTRASFLTEIEALIVEKFGGNVTRHSAITLTIGKKVR